MVKYTYYIGGIVIMGTIISNGIMFGGGVIIDTALSANSNNAVTNAAITTGLNGKQDSTDNNLETTSKQVVGAINEIMLSLCEHRIG